MVLGNVVCTGFKLCIMLSFALFIFLPVFVCLSVCCLSLCVFLSVSCLLDILI